MKTTNKIFALALMAVAMVFASCSKDNGDDPVGPTQQEIETKIIGKWKTVDVDGKECLTNEKSVTTYYSDGIFTTSVSTDFDFMQEHIWDNIERNTYSLSGIVMTQMHSNESVTNSHICDINNDYFVEHIFKFIKDSQEIELNRVFRNAKVTADYTQDVIGMWEGVEMTGYETYGGIEARIEYNADGTYTYYNKVNGEWVVSANVDNEYNVDGDWLATRWRSEAGKDYNYEWWDIDYIKDGTMKWSALREKEDGTRFTTTFTWKKVEKPTQQEIESKIIGKWKSMSKYGNAMLTNHRNIRTYNPNGIATLSYSALKDGKHYWINKTECQYSITNNVIDFLCSEENIEFITTIQSISDGKKSVSERKIINGDRKDDKPNIIEDFVKVTADYTQDIIGMWEGVEMTGDETYGNAEARIAYHADGTYTYYKKENGEWQPLEDVFDEWNVDGDWLATRWQNNGSDVMNYEWWDIDYIKDGIMKWSALREKEDGTRFTTTFTWKKINLQ